MNRRGFLAGAATGALAFVDDPSAWAESFPTRTIRIVVPAGTSSPPDLTNRIIAGELSGHEGWNVIIENKPGGAQTIGAGAVFNQPADGYTLLAATPPVAAIPGLVPNAPFKVESDFKPVIQIGVGYNVLVVNPGVPARSVSELVTYLKRDPGQHTFSSGGFGTPAHLLGELFMLETGISAAHVPYSATAQAIGGLVGGQNTYQFISLVSVMQLLQTGQLRALAIMGPKRVAAVPDVPTIIEVGFPKLAAADWSGILAPAGTPAEVIQRLNNAINTALNAENVRSALTKLGVDIVGGPPEQFASLLHSEIERWTKVIKEANIKIG